MYPAVHAEKTPDKPAYVMARSGRVVTYRELDERSNQGAQLFRSLGLRRGDHIALCMENHEEFLSLAWAAQRSGLYFTTISSRLTAPEVEYIVDDCAAKVLVTSAAKGEMAQGLTGACPGLIARYMVGEPGPGFESWEAALNGQATDPIEDESEGAPMLYSSGTTGRPKGVKHPLPSEPIGTPPPILAAIMGLYGADDRSVYLSPAPLYHAAPLGFTMSFLRTGATLVIMEQFDALEALQLIEKHRVTHSQWVPTMFVRMLKLPEEERARPDVSSLQAAIHAAAPCPVPVKEQMIEWWGPVIHEYYAGTEANGFCAINSEQWLAHKGSVGQPLNATVHILDENMEKLPPGEIGGIYFESPTTFEYHNAPEKTEDSKSPQGYTTLGDVGYLDEEGWLYLTDRKAHMIISGGVNIYPQETENALITHPKVVDVAVIGVPNEDFGEEVKAVVQPVDMAEAGPDLEAELMTWCREQISSVKCPRSIDFEPELPRHPTGKLYKRLLKDRYWGKTDSRIV
ncbi:MAG: acyl-CoA synthetase [Deltaproteobacteria bacterium]|jgi:acyl-CoA synthetase (AMP-forming)/AMP-acid ligase II|nr:acyl-CoA synthetase [Deltaproteobacteria bacterium]